MATQIVAATDIGHLRRRNEDHAVVDSELVTGNHREHGEQATPPVLLAVLDGMGGHPAGDVASRLVAEGLAEADPPPASGDAVRTLVPRLEQRLLDHMRTHPDTTAMGTTLVGATVSSASEALVFGIGDSLALWCADGELSAILPRDRGPFGGITQVLGGAPTSEDPRPHVATVHGPGRLLLCSDGLSDVVDAATIIEALGDDDLADAAAMLVRAALDRGGPDNVTVALAELAADEHH